MKTILTTTVFVLFAFNFFSQDSLSTRMLLNKTEIALNKAQKEIIAGHVQNQTSNLEMSVKYQVKAVKAYQNGNYASAVNYSSLSREILNTMLASYNERVAAYFLFNDNETLLQTQSNFSSSKSSLNADPASIDQNILLSPIELPKNYKITLN